MLKISWSVKHRQVLRVGFELGRDKKVWPKSQRHEFAKPRAAAKHEILFIKPASGLSM